MYYHFIPKYYSDTHKRDCFLASFSIPELGLYLTEKELKTVKPYPNKRYSVGCLKHGFHGRNFIGLVVESEKILSEFTKICEWSVYPTNRADPDIAFVMKHITRYHLLDHDYPMFSDDCFFLDPQILEGQSYPSRKPADWPESRNISSVMEFNSQIFLGTGLDKASSEETKPFDDFYGARGMIVEREQVINFHTLSPDLYQMSSRIPARKLPLLENAYRIASV